MIEDLPILLLAAAFAIAMAAAGCYAEQARKWKLAAELAKADAAAANLKAYEARYAAYEAAHPTATAPAAPVADVVATDPMVERMRVALKDMGTAAKNYREYAQALEVGLEQAQTERDDWAAAAQYHADTAKQLYAERAELESRNHTLQTLYAARTQQALTAGLIRFVWEDAGFTQDRNKSNSQE